MDFVWKRGQFWANWDNFASYCGTFSQSHDFARILYEKWLFLMNSDTGVIYRCWCIIPFDDTYTAIRSFSKFLDEPYKRFSIWQPICLSLDALWPWSKRDNYECVWPTERSYRRYSSHYSSWWYPWEHCGALKESVSVLMFSLNLMECVNPGVLIGRNLESILNCSSHDSPFCFCLVFGSRDMYIFCENCMLRFSVRILFGVCWGSKDM